VAAFTDLDWSRFDALAIVSDGGLASIDERDQAACRDWLCRE
jgi:hypothetical protein